MIQANERQLEGSSNSGRPSIVHFSPPGDPCHLHPDGLALLVALSFPYIQCFYDYKTRKTKERAGVFKCPRDKEVSRDQAQWNMDAAEWINSEQNGKQKSETVCARENAQQEEFQKWVDPTKDSLLGTDQIAFLRAISFPLHGGERDEDLNRLRLFLPTRSVQEETLREVTLQKRAKKNSGSSRVRAQNPLTPSAKSS
jgi:hypothetical protein